MRTKKTFVTMQGRWRKLAWLPIPLLLVIMVAVWVADLRIVWPLPFLYSLVHYGTPFIGITFIVIRAALSFLSNGQPSVLMLGCGMLMIEIGAVAMPAAFSKSSDYAFAIYNTSVFLGALCHFAGIAVASRRKIRLEHSAIWLPVCYAGVIAVMGVVIWSTLSGRMPVFFTEGQGGTLFRSLVISTAVVFFLQTAGLLWQTYRRAASPFLYWYALGLILLAIGLTGSIAIAVSNSPLQWIARFAQVLATVYMSVAAWAPLRETGGTHGFALAAVEEAWREDKSLARLQQKTLLGVALRYGLAAIAVAAAMMLRQVLTGWVGPGLPTYIMFYPAVVAVALLAGAGPGIAATAFAGLAADYFILPPIGQFALASPIDRLGLVLFIGMGLLVSMVAELYRRNRDKAAAYDQELVLHKIRQEKEFLADLLKRAAQPFAVGYPDGRLGIFNHAYERLTGYSAAELRTLDWSASLTPPEWRNLEKQKLDELNRTSQPVRYEKEYIRKDGTRVPIELLVQIARDPQGNPEYYSFVADITERKKMEQALKESEKKYRELIKYAPTGIYEIDFRTKKFLTVNDSMILLSGYTREEFLSMTALDILDDESKSVFLERVSKCFSGEKPDEDVEYKIRAKDGHFYDVLLNMKFNMDEQGNPIGATVVGHDISERKKAEDILRYQASMLEAVNDAIIGTDLSFKIKFWNKGAERIYGWKEIEVLGKPVDDVMRSDISQEQRTAMHKDLENGKPVFSELVQFTREGQLRIIDSYMMVQHNSQEKITGYVSINRDITERKQIEMALKNSEARFRTLADNIPDQITQFDCNLLLLYANQAVLNRTGLGAEALIGRTAHEYGALPEAAADWEKAAREVINTGMRKTCEQINYWKGEKRIMEVQIVPDRDANGTLQTIIAISHDITERKNMEEELRKKVSELAAANNELESYSYSISHDLRAPLRAIGGFSSVLLDDYANKLDGEAQDYLMRIISSSAKMSSLIDDMLNMAKISHHDMLPQKIDLKTIAKAIFAELQAAEPANKIKMAISENLTVHGDPHLMQIALSNLISNAWKYSSKTPGAWIEFGKMEKEGQKIYYVRDNGVGFNMEYADKLFVPFQRLHSENEFPGTGIGLAVIKRAIEKHGGKIWAESEKGKGATFYFTLPDHRNSLR